MADEAEATAIAFNDAINARDVGRLTPLMTEGHRFIDSAGEVVAGRRACAEAWRGFFSAFPDYRNVFRSVGSTGAGVVEIVGHSECSVATLAGPARWRAVIVDGLIDEWQVFVDG